jgi:hypothetical protein
MRLVFALGLVALCACASSESQTPVDESTAEKRGCCSHHGGVCGCSGDRQLCCDGQLSPSCMCGSADGDAELDDATVDISSCG